MHRPFSETLVDLASAATPFEREAPMLRVTSVSVDVPIRVRLQRIGGELEFFADLPLWRWQTLFDERPGRLTIRWEEGVEG
jgi:hypothetical protein